MRPTDDEDGHGRMEQEGWEMTATDELRMLLDGFGVLHGYSGEDDVVWWSGDGETLYEARTVLVVGEPTDSLEVRCLTPEQAILATLGPDPREIKPAGGLARGGICRESMPGRDGPIGRLHSLAEGVLDAVRLGAVTGEGIDRTWCRELYDRYSAELAEIGFGEVGR